jgi:hypothetical protein
LRQFRFDGSPSTQKHRKPMLPGTLDACPQWRRGPVSQGKCVNVAANSYDNVPNNNTGSSPSRRRGSPASRPRRCSQQQHLQDSCLQRRRGPVNQGKGVNVAANSYNNVPRATALAQVHRDVEGLLRLVQAVLQQPAPATQRRSGDAATWTTATSTGVRELPCQCRQHPISCIPSPISVWARPSPHAARAA